MSKGLATTSLLKKALKKLSIYNPRMEKLNHIKSGKKEIRGQLPIIKNWGQLQSFAMKI